MKYIFTDSNNNSYLLDRDQLSYSPITKANSSSGIYDGGVPFSKKLSKIQLIKLVDVFERAIWAVNDQVKTRTKGSSVLSKPAQEISVILKYNSNPSSAISKILAEISKTQ